MSELSQRRDLADPDVISRFAARVAALRRADSVTCTGNSANGNCDLTSAVLPSKMPAQCSVEEIAPAMRQRRDQRDPSSVSGGRPRTKIS